MMKNYFRDEKLLPADATLSYHNRRRVYIYIHIYIAK